MRSSEAIHPRSADLGNTLKDAASVDGALIDWTQVNFSWLHKLRWAALAGQLSTIVVVAAGLGIELPLGKLLPIMLLGAATNIALGCWLRYRSASWPRWAWRGEWVAGSLMMFDNLLLTALLYFSGGPSNPFTIFYMVNIALAAVVLRARWAWILNAAAFFCFALLFSVHVSLPELEHGHAHEHALHHHTRTAAGPMSLHLQGSLVAFGCAATFIVYFITRVTTELARREAELNAARQRKAQSDKLNALATLAAGAAHELASPLTTIAVLARDLELSMAASKPGDPKLGDADASDVRLIRSEVDRCRRILNAMASSAGESIGEELVRISPAELLAAARRELAAADRVDIADAPAMADSGFRLPKVAVCQALRAIVQNALDASPPAGRVAIAAGESQGLLTITVSDAGAGMSEDVLRRACEPFFTTKEPGYGLGLGLFFAHRIIEQLGGSLTIESTVGQGTTATVRLPLENAAIAEEIPAR